MQPHHEEWLAAHPYRSAEWLRERIADGFDVHHIDGDHDNNDPTNLILIEHGDHMALHNGGVIIEGRMRLGKRKRRPARRRQKRAWDEYHVTRERLKAEYA